MRGATPSSGSSPLLTVFGRDVDIYTKPRAGHLATSPPPAVPPAQALSATAAPGVLVVTNWSLRS